VSYRTFGRQKRDSKNPMVAQQHWKKKSSPAFVISRSISTSFNPQKLVL